MATLPGAWRYRVSAGTGWPGVSILWLVERESLVCNFYLSVTARKIEQIVPEIHSNVAGTLSNQQTTSLVTSRITWLLAYNFSGLKWDEANTQLDIQTKQYQQSMHPSRVREAKGSSASAFPARSLGFTIVGSIVFTHVTVLFNPTTEVVTCHLHAWCMLGVFQYFTF